MLSRKYKSAFGTFVRPLSDVLHRLHVNPVHLTAAGLFCSVLAALAFSQGLFATGGVLLTLSGFSDMLDGSLARSSGEATPFGSFIDSVTDRYSELFTFGGLAYYYSGSSTLILVLFALGGSLMVSYTRARAESLVGKCEVGLMERPERMIILIAASFFGFMYWGLWLLAVGTNATAMERIYHTRKISRGKSH